MSPIAENLSQQHVRPTPGPSTDKSLRGISKSHLTSISVIPVIGRLACPTRFGLGAFSPPGDGRAHRWVGAVLMAFVWAASSSGWCQQASAEAQLFLDTRGTETFIEAEVDFTESFMQDESFLFSPSNSASHLQDFVVDDSFFFQSMISVNAQAVNRHESSFQGTGPGNTFSGFTVDAELQTVFSVAPAEQTNGDTIFQRVNISVNNALSLAFQLDAPHRYTALGDLANARGSFTGPNGWLVFSHLAATTTTIDAGGILPAGAYNLSMSGAGLGVSQNLPPIPPPPCSGTQMASYSLDLDLIRIPEPASWVLGLLGLVTLLLVGNPRKARSSRGSGVLP